MLLTVFNSRILFKFQIFCTVKNLEMLCRSNKIFMDGTFKIVPNIFKQLYTIHGRYLGKVFPLVYCLLANKQQQTYRRMLNSIKEEGEKRRLSLKLEEAILDFELGAINAVKDVFPASNIKGCFFHFAQCVWRKVS